ncbi:venom allergen 5-like [Coccinella septempunctata]|uniref:venom allergen 5-like n=1 Tax=Coccinella septempunctata TaxID=41139 RepID=UPI001D066804|nr:venom allergen 5-like [Coccinella septempunctata]XP_044763288.1 venom allergen 5-like [Coccinella septempunctata]
MSLTSQRWKGQKLKSVPIVLLVLLSLSALVSSGPSFNYCSLKCRGDIHTVCARRHRCGPVSGCNPIEPTVEFREFMVKEHNELRNKIASGSDGSQYSNKGAKNMNAVSYDLELEYIAQCWANVCHTLEHDKCRNSKRFPCGQNIYWGSNSNETKDAVRAWYGEIQYMTNPAWIDKLARPGEPNAYPNDKKMRGHFTQVVWAKTKYIGCARVRYGKNNIESQLICNYGPAGNFVGESIYKMAGDHSQIASECKDGKNSEYGSLCGRIEPVPTEKGWARAEKSASNSLIVNCFVLGVWLLFTRM